MEGSKNGGVRDLKTVSRLRSSSLNIFFELFLSS